LVIVKGTEFFDGKTSRYVDYPVTDVLQMMGRAGRPQFDTVGIACVLVQEGKKNFYRKFLYEPFPVESCLRNRICEILNAEIATQTITSVADAAGYMKWTYFWRRLLRNPSYYNCPSGSEADVDRFLKELVAETLEKLTKSGCVKVVERAKHESDSTFLGTDEDRSVLIPTGLGKVTCTYYLLHQSAFEFREGLRELKSNLQEAKNSGLAGEALQTGCLHHILKLVTSSSEFNEIPVRHNEEHLNKDLAGELRWGADKDMEFDDPHTKAFLLVQAWLERGKKVRGSKCSECSDLLKLFYMKTIS
jgi:activating signal cointegrator complex subunit 3